MCSSHGGNDSSEAPSSPVAERFGGSDELLSSEYQGDNSRGKFESSGDLCSVVQFSQFFDSLKMFILVLRMSPIDKELWLVSVEK